MNIKLNTSSNIIINDYTNNLFEQYAILIENFSQKIKRFD